MDDQGRVIGAGVLFDAVPGSDYCNGRVAPIIEPGACLNDHEAIKEFLEKGRKRIGE
jgi:hypothetical protein